MALTVRQASSSHLTAASRDSDNLLDELRKLLETLAVIVNSRKEEEKPGYWTRKTKTINKVFFVIYLIAVIVFLGYMVFSWSA